MQDQIMDVRANLQAGRFPNEAAVSTGVVMRLLQALGWPVFDTTAVIPEYAVGGRRVDYALCVRPRQPVAFIEVKQVGQSDGAERQLFEYAFHQGIPLAILTDGQSWSFFLPAEQGDYGDRRVYKLDLLERDPAEVTERLQRYLSYQRVVDGKAIADARDDYRDAARQREIQRTFPDAWRRLIQEEDETLVELLGSRVEQICGFRPDPDSVAAFLRILPHSATTVAPALRSIGGSQQRLNTTPPPPPTFVANGQTNASAPIMFSLDGRTESARNAIDLLRKILEAFQERDASFLDRFAALPRHGRTRRWVARSQSELYPGRPDLCEGYAAPLAGGWWFGTNHSRSEINKIIVTAADVARAGSAEGFTFSLGS